MRFINNGTIEITVYPKQLPSQIKRNAQRPNGVSGQIQASTIAANNKNPMVKATNTRAPEIKSIVLTCFRVFSNCWLTYPLTLAACRAEAVIAGLVGEFISLAILVIPINYLCILRSLASPHLCKLLPPPTSEHARRSPLAFDTNSSFKNRQRNTSQNTLRT